MSKILPIAEAAHKRLRETELGLLGDQHLKIIAFFATDVLKLERWKVKIYTTTIPKRVVVVPLTKDGEPLRIKFKEEERFLHILSGMLQLPDYTVELYKHESS